MIGKNRKKINIQEEYQCFYAKLICYFNEVMQCLQLFFVLNLHLNIGNLDFSYIVSL